MKLPFVRRKSLDELQARLDELQARYDSDRGIIAYIPAEYPKRPDGTPIQIPAEDYCFHDRRIGWVRAKRFGTYEEYCTYLKTIYHDNGWATPHPQSNTEQEAE